MRHPHCQWCNNNSPHEPMVLRSEVGNHVFERRPERYLVFKQSGLKVENSCPGNEASPSASVSARAPFLPTFLPLLSLRVLLSPRLPLLSAPHFLSSPSTPAPSLQTFSFPPPLPTLLLLCIPALILAQSIFASTARVQNADLFSSIHSNQGM